MRIAFLGNAEFGIPTLKALKESRHELVGVITSPDKPAGRGRQMRPTPVKQVALEENLPLLTPDDLKDPDFLQAYRAWRPEVAVVVAFRILPLETFDLPDHGTLNIHPSLLPKYRGPAPIQWALINGEGETGISVIRITRKIDAGGIILQFRERINPMDTFGELHDRMAERGSRMIIDAIEKIEDKRVDIIPQDERQVSRAPKLTKEDGLINWNQAAFRVHNQVRGVTPVPGAYTRLAGEKLKLFLSRLTNGREGRPGEILEADEMLLVACQQGAVSFAEVQREGKKRMPVKEYLRGAELPVGKILGE